MSFEDKNILIVEDNELNMKLFIDLLSNLGSRLIECRDGRDALNLVKIEHPDLIIMDIQLPFISGIELTKQIKSEDALKHIPVIAVTAYAMSHDKEKIEESGVDEYITKPIQIDSFLQAVKKYLTN